MLRACIFSQAENDIKMFKFLSRRTEEGGGAQGSENSNRGDKYQLDNQKLLQDYIKQSDIIWGNTYYMLVTCYTRKHESGQYVAQGSS